MSHQVIPFLQKRWVRILGIFPATFYTLMAGLVTISLIEITIFRPPNSVFPEMDMVDWVGLLFLSSIVFLSGVCAIVTAHFMRGFFRVLYFAGFLGIVGPCAHLPLTFVFNADVDFYPEITDEQFLVGDWKCEDYLLELREDGSFSVTIDEAFLFEDEGREYSGNWSHDLNKLTLMDEDADWSAEWEVRESDGYYFITYSVPETSDAWDGDLGMMRSDEWDATH